MTETCYDLLKAVRLAFSVKPYKVKTDSKLSDIYAIAEKHSILPIVCEGIIKYQSFEIEPEVKEKVFKCVLVDQVQMCALQTIEDAFLQNKIDYMLLKGSSIKSLYPKSEMRLMGDIDILIKEDQYAEICPIMEKLGFTAVDETNHELIWCNSTGVVVELHKKLIPSYNDDYYTYFEDCWNLAKQEGDTTQHKMIPEIEYVYLVTHFAKHYRDGGIGLRHVIDLWRYIEENQELNFGFIEEELNKIGLRIFEKNIRNLIEVWFYDKTGDAITEHMTERIFKSGSFGMKEVCDTAYATRVTNRNKSSFRAKIKNALQLCFPSLQMMQKRFPILLKYPVFLPILWIVRWIDSVFNRRNNIVCHYRRFVKMNRETTNQYEKELELVGLRFDLDKTVQE